MVPFQPRQVEYQICQHMGYNLIVTNSLRHTHRTPRAFSNIFCRHTIILDLLVNQDVLGLCTVVGHLDIEIGDICAPLR